MAAVDVAALGLLRKKRSAAAWCASVTFTLLAAVLLASVSAAHDFAAFCLLAYGLFLHGPVVLAGSAALLRRSRPRTAILSAAAALLPVAVAVDAFWIEPGWLEVSRVAIASNKIDQPIRVVVLADLQTDQIGSYQRSVFQRVLREKPDVILLAGDYLQVDAARREDLRSQLNKLLHEIGFADSGRVFAVRGNADHGGWGRIFDGLDVTTVGFTQSFDVGVNPKTSADASHGPEAAQEEPVRESAPKGLRLTCLGLIDSYDTSLAIPNDSPEKFHLVVGHVPNFALGHVEADLLVAGHTHGGQVRLPWFGPLITLSDIPRSWAAGVTDLPGGRKLIVSRGVGMERRSAPRVRFLCRPELVVIDLVPAPR